MAKGMTAAAAVEKWAKNAGSAGADYVKGVQSMSENPMDKAAAAVDKYAAGCAEAASNGAFADGCRSVSLATLKQIAEQKGAPNYANGVRSMRPEKKARMVAAVQTSKDVGQAVSGMSTMTLEDRIAKAAEYMRQRSAARSTRR